MNVANSQPGDDSPCCFFPWRPWSESASHAKILGVSHRSSSWFPRPSPSHGRSRWWDWHGPRLQWPLFVAPRHQWVAAATRRLLSTWPRSHAPDQGRSAEVVGCWMLLDLTTQMNKTNRHQRHLFTKSGKSSSNPQKRVTLVVTFKASSKCKLSMASDNWTLLIAQSYLDPKGRTPWGHSVLAIDLLQELCILWIGARVCATLASGTTTLLSISCASPISMLYSVQSILALSLASSSPSLCTNKFHGF